MKTISHYEMDMTTGSIFRKVVRYSIPLMLTGILQLLYNAADVIVVGQYSGKEALAAVGSTGSLINLLINVFMGFSVGTSVVVARQQGAGNRHAVMETVHTSIALALICGFSIGLFGFLMAKPILLWMGSPEDVIDASSLYVRIYFLGMPANMLYTFGSAILRAVGDTKRPLYYLSAAGLVNIVLNLFFVIVLKMSVAGVAIATIISQAISAVLVIRCLMRSTGTVRYIPKMTRLHREPLRQILHIGLPAGLQGSLFSVSNVLIQSSVNSFGSVVMAGSAASSNLEGFVYTTMDSICQACLTFTGQNVGACQYRRVRKILLVCMAVCTFIGILTGGLFSIFAPQLISIYNTDPTVIQWGTRRLVIFCLTYFLCGQMNLLVGHMRGLGYSVLPMITTLAGVCGLRIVWIYTCFALYPTLEVLMWSYPISWFITTVCHAVTYHLIRKRFPREDLPLPDTVAA